MLDDGSGCRSFTDVFPLVVTSPGCLTCLCDVYSLTLTDFCQVLQLKLEGCAYFEFDTCTRLRCALLMINI